MLDGVKDLAGTVAECVCPWLRKFKVSYFQTVPSATPGVNRREWVQQEIMAYNRYDAVAKINEMYKPNPPLKHSRNCFVSRVLGSKK